MKLRVIFFKYAVYTATIYINYVFSPIMALMGKKHEIQSGDNSWALTVGMAFVVSMFFALKSILSKHNLHYGKNLLLFPLLFFLCAFFIEYAFFPVQVSGSYPVSRWYLFSLLYVWPAVFIGIDVATEDSLDQIYKWVDVLAVLITLGMIPMLGSLGIEERISMGGDNYQAVSYMGAFSSGILLYGLFSPYQKLRFKFFRLKAFKIISVALILVNVAAVFISGGRGGALLLILNSIICLFVFNRKGIIKKTIIAIVALLVFSSLFGRFLSSYGLSDFFEMGIERSFSYISGGNLDMTETSERDVVYKVAIENINNYPVLGQGIFRPMSMYGGYPHNFFLEILVDGGMVYLLFWIAYLWFFFNKLFRIIRREPAKSYLLILASLPLLSLLFSGTYTNNAYFWFVISCIFIYQGGNLKYNSRRIK